MLECDKCGGKILEGAKFCPHCGDPVTEADRPVAGIATSAVADVEISFGSSSSKNYEQALAMCRNVPSFAEGGMSILCGFRAARQVHCVPIV